MIVHKHNNKLYANSRLGKTNSCTIMKVLAAYIVILILECAMAMVASPLVIDNHLCKAENLKV